MGNKSSIHISSRAGRKNANVPDDDNFLDTDLYMELEKKTVCMLRVGCELRTLLGPYLGIFSETCGLFEPA